MSNQTKQEALWLPRRAWTAIRKEGFRAAMWRAIRSAWSCKNYTVYLKVLQEADAQADHRDVAFRIATNADIAWISANMSHLGDWAQDLLRQQFVNSHDLTTIGVGKNPETLVFCAWVSRDHFALSLVAPQNQGQDASMRRVWVPQAYRRKGIAGRGMEFTEQQARLSGVRNMWSCVLKDNTPSQRLHEKLHYDQSGQIHLLTRFGRRFARWRIGQHRRWTKSRIPNEISVL